MRKSLYAAGALVFLTFLLAPAFGVEWVEAGGHQGPITTPQRVMAPTPAGNGMSATAGQIKPIKGGSPEAGIPSPLEYVYIDPGLYSIWTFPWYAYTSEMRFQTVYYSNQINRGGKIHEMALFKSYYGSYYNATFPNVTVKLANVTTSSLGSSFSGNYGGATPVTVFHASSLARGYVDPNGNYYAWDTVDFSTDFQYDSTKNLLVEITWAGSPSGTYAYSWMTYISQTRVAYYYGSDTTNDYAYTANYEFNTRLGFVPPAANVGVSKILAPAVLNAFGDSIWPMCVIANYGSASQTNVPVRCLIYDKASGTQVYNQLVTVPNLAVGGVDTVAFPYYVPPITEANYIDTMRTELPGDAKPGDDWQAGTFKVTEVGSQCLSFNDGTFDNAISWVAAGHEWADKFGSPTKPLAVNQSVVWLSSRTGSDYSSEVRIYGDDGGAGKPGTQIGNWVGNLHSTVWPAPLYRNELPYDPPVSVNYDSFFVSYYQTSISPAYPYVGMDETPPIQLGNDWENWNGWQLMGPNAGFYDNQLDLGIEGCFTAPLLDGSITDIPFPPAVIDSNTTFDPQIVVSNVGLIAKSNIPVAFNIYRNANVHDTLFAGTANSGPVKNGASKTITFTGANINPIPLGPGLFTMTGICTMPYDHQNANDTLHMPLFVRYYDIKTVIQSPRKQEVPGLVPVAVKLLNLGNVPATVPQLDVNIMPAGYHDLAKNIVIPAMGSNIVTLQPWVCPAGVAETTTAYITDPSDMYSPDDTMIQQTLTGIPGWTELTSLPAPPSGKTIKDGGCMAYDALTDQIYASKGNKTGDFYSYNVGTGTWTTLTAIPLGAEEKEVYKGSVLCSDGNGTLYLTKGNNTIGFWSYNTTTKAWTQLTNVPTGSSGKKVKQGAGIAWATKNGKGYVYLLKGYRNEFYKYDPGTNSWTNLLDAPIGIANHLKYDAGSWIVADADAGNMVYAFKAKYHEMYKYYTDKDSWSPAVSAMPIPGSAGDKKAKDGSCAAWYNGKIYAFKGGNTSEFWRYFPLADSWHKQDDIPLVGTSGLRKKVKAGAALAGYPGTGIYGFKGNKSLEFWRFTPYDVVGAQPSRDGVTGSSTGIASVGFAIAPNPLSSGYATVRYSLPKAGMATLNVFDVTGRTVLTQTLAAGRTGTASLDLRKLEAGVYLVKVATEGFSTTQKLVVEH